MTQLVKQMFTTTASRVTKPLTAIAIAFLAVFTSFAQEVKKGDLILSAGANIGFSPNCAKYTYDSEGTLKDMVNKSQIAYGGKLAVEYIVADGLCNDKVSVGIGAASNYLTHQALSDAPMVGQYKYTYTMYIFTYDPNAGSRRTPTSQECKREGMGSAQADYVCHDINLMLTGNLHYAFTPKFDTYLTIGAGAVMRMTSIKNMHNEKGFSAKWSEGSFEQTKKEHQTTFKYNYRDLDHVTWDDEVKNEYKPAVALSFGARYFFNQHWGAQAEVGLTTWNLYKKRGGFSLGSIGACYKF